MGNWQEQMLRDADAANLRKWARIVTTFKSRNSPEAWRIWNSVFIRLYMVRLYTVQQVNNDIRNLVEYLES